MNVYVEYTELIDKVYEEEIVKHCFNYKTTAIPRVGECIIYDNGENRDKIKVFSVEYYTDLEYNEVIIMGRLVQRE